ncbi:MAG: hypothetical protein ACLFPE_05425 [Bacteroidales bacterium]
MNLGEIMLNGGKSTTCTVMMSFDDLTGANGSRAAFTANSEESNLSLNLDSNGTKKIKLEAAAGEEIFTNVDKQYTGGYQITFVYN